MSFAERTAEALAGTQSLVLIGNDVRDDVYQAATEWGFQLASLKATELANFGEGHPLWNNRSRAHYLLVIEDAHLLSADDEDNLLDLIFDGCVALPANTLIAAHFGQTCTLTEMLDDENVPVTLLRKTISDVAITIAGMRGIPVTDLKITRANPSDLRGLPLAA